MLVAQIATMSVGITSCSEEKKEPVDRSYLIMGEWKCFIDQCKNYRIEFYEDSTYSYESPEVGNGSGNYRILATLKNREVRLGDRDGDPINDATLFIIEVSSNDVFDQLWVYHFISLANTPCIAVDYYSNNVLLTGYLWVLLNL